MAPLSRNSESNVSFIFVTVFLEAIHQDPMSSFPMTMSHWHHADNNYSHFQHLYFVFTGIPGLEQKYYQMTFPLGAVYVIALFGNSIIISTITSESSLHIPMYHFLCMLALADMGLAVCTLPSMLGIFLFNYKPIAFDACLVQMYFIHTFSAIESGVLVAMAFDQVVAIWTPLRYSTILTNGVVCKTGLVILSRAVCVVFPVPFLIKRLPFYHSNILSHSFCLHQDVMHLACASTRVNGLYGLIAVIFTKGSDSLSILLSYVFILQTVMAIASREGWLKALNTCVSHICAVLIFYVPLIGVSVIHRFGKPSCPHGKCIPCCTPCAKPHSLYCENQRNTKEDLPDVCWNQDYSRRLESACLREAAIL